MGSRLELVSPEGLRVDGRRCNEMRNIRSSLSVLSHADGSAYLEQGNTKCLVAVWGPRECRRRGDALHDRALINVEYKLATFASGERKRTRKGDRRMLEVASSVKQTFETAIQTTLFPRSQIDISIQILQADGGIAATAINGCTLAIMDAGIPMVDYVCAASTAYLDGTPCLDLNQIEENTKPPRMTIAVLPRSGAIAFMQTEARLHVDKVAALTSLATQGGIAVQAAMKASVVETTEDFLRRRGPDL